MKEINASRFLLKKAVKRTLICLLVCACILGMAGCGTAGEQDVKITIPAGSEREIAYSEVEIFSKKSSITIYAGEGLGDTEVTLRRVGNNGNLQSYTPAYLTPGMPVHMDVEPGEWYQVGVSVQNSGSEDIVVYVTVKDIELRIQ